MSIPSVISQNGQEVTLNVSSVVGKVLQVSLKKEKEIMIVPAFKSGEVAEAKPLFYL